MIYGQPITFAGASAPKLFGNGSDGVGLFTSSTTWLAETEDTGMIVKNFESLTISQGVTVAAGNRNCGMIIRVKGDCTIHGTLANKMSCKTLLDSDGVDFSAYPASMLNGVAGDGGAGGKGAVRYTIQGPGGSGMAGRFYGGGWSGGGSGGGSTGYSTTNQRLPGDGGSVANVTTATTAIFVGGAGGPRSGHGKAGTNGGGGGGSGHSSPNSSGGPGGTGPGANGGGGVSDNTYNGNMGGGAGNYGGGVIILLVGGNLKITGSIDCSGCNGGSSGVANDYTYQGGPGGGGGGGRIFICHKGDISNTGTLNVNGGSSGSILGKNYADTTAAVAGTAGTAGTTAVKTYEQYKKEDAA